MDICNQRNHNTHFTSTDLSNMNKKKQIVQPADTSPALYDKGIQRVQNIVRVLLYVGREVDENPSSIECNWIPEISGNQRNIRRNRTTT